jgi:hypothetical protein
MLRGGPSAWAGAQAPAAATTISDNDDDDIQITSMRLAPPKPRVRQAPAPAPRAVVPPPPRISPNMMSQITNLHEEEKHIKRVELTCVICMSIASDTTQLSSTICGHIFCEDCIRDALAAKVPGGKKCPVCRKSLAGKNSVHRLYVS